MPQIEFLKALKETDKVAFIESLITAHGGGLTPDEKTKLSHLLVTKDFNADIADDNIQVAFNRIAALGLDASGNNLVSNDEIELLGTQTIPIDPAVAAGSKSLITVGNTIKALKDLQTYLEANLMHNLDPDNPTMPMHVSATGTAAQMQVVDDETNHIVATMTWHKPTQTFTFALFDKDTGARKIEFLMSPDGRIYMNQHQIFNQSDLGDIHTYVAGKTLTEKLMELKTQVDTLSHATSTTIAEPVIAGAIPVSGDEGGFVMVFLKDMTDNPVNVGKDIEDGSEHYVKFTQKSGTPLITKVQDWVWATDNGNQPVRLWTNDAKSKAMDAQSLKTYINVGAFVKIIKTAGEWFVKDIFMPAVPQGTIKAILNDGSIKMEAGYVANDDMDVATVKTIREFRQTVVHDIVDHAKPSVAECVDTFKLLPHFDWLLDDEYYIKDTSGGKLVLIKYRTKTGATETDHGNFFFEVLTMAH